MTSSTNILDRVRHQIVTVFPNFVLQKTQNAMALVLHAQKLRSHHPSGSISVYAETVFEMRKRDCGI